MYAWLTIIEYFWHACSKISPCSADSREFLVDPLIQTIVGMEFEDGKKAMEKSCLAD